MFGGLFVSAVIFKVRVASKQIAKGGGGQQQTARSSSTLEKMVCQVLAAFWHAQGKLAFIGKTRHISFRRTTVAKPRKIAKEAETGRPR